MFLGLDFEKLLLIAAVAAMILGPQKLPGLARQFARFVVRARGWVDDAKGRVKDELGDDMGAVDWRQLDPRQYDPRRIIRQALLEEPTPAAPVLAPATTTTPAPGPADAQPAEPEPATESAEGQPATPAETRAPSAP